MLCNIYKVLWYLLQLKWNSLSNNKQLSTEMGSPQRDWKSGFTKLLGLSWEENGWCHLLVPLPAYEFIWGKLLFVWCSPTESRNIPAVFKCSLVETMASGWTWQDSSFRGFPGLTICVYVTKWKTAKEETCGLEAKGINWLLPTWLRPHHRAEQSRFGYNDTTLHLALRIF